MLYGRSESIERNITVIVAQSKHNASSFKFGICYPTELTHWKRPWCWEGLGAGGEEDNRGWDGWMASLTRRTWVWVNSGSWWWTGRPGMLRFMGSQRVGHDWATELTELNTTEAPVFNLFAIQFGDRCPRTHITGSGTGLAQKGVWPGKRTSLWRLGDGKSTSAPLTGCTTPFSHLKFTWLKSSSEQIF